MKRVISFVIVISLVLGLLGMVSLTAFAETIISSVELTFTEPVIGGNVADSILTAPEDAGYTVSSYWYDQTAFQSVDSGTFQDGHRYRLTIGVYPKEGYSIDEGAVILLNGQEDPELYYYMDTEAGSLTGSREYVLVSNPVTIELTIPEPEVGALFSETVLTAPDGAEYEVWSGWYAGDADVWEDEALTEGTFEDGKEYILWGGIDSDAIQGLNNVTAVTVNGEDVGWYFTDDLYNGIYLEQMSYPVAEPTLIEQVEITGVTTPVVGETATAEGIVCSTEGVTLTAYWTVFDYEAGTYFHFSDTFQEGNICRLRLILDAKKDYEFAYGAEENITVNGGAPSYAAYYWSTHIEVEMIYFLTDVETVDSVVIEQLPQLTVGENVSLERLTAGFVLPEDAGYRISSVEFMDNDYNDFTGTLERREYQYCVRLAPKEGYWFDAANMEYTVPDSCDAYMEVNTEEITLRIYVDLRDPVQQVELTVPEFKAGDAVSTEGITVTGGTLGEAVWYDNSWEEISGTFGEEDYYLEISVNEPEGFCYTDDTVILINGQAVSEEDIWVSSNELYITYTLKLRVPGILIQQVDLPAFPEAIQPGQTLETELLPVPDGTPYMAMITWVDVAAGEPVTAAGQQGMYACAYVLLPNEGYEFSEDTVITVNGKRYNGVSLIDFEQAMVMKIYSVGYPLVDRIDLTVNAPAIGQTAEGQTLQLENAEGYAEWYANESGDIYDMDTQMVDTFQKGMYHYLIVQLTAAEGYAFSDTLTAVINGKTVEAEFVNMGSSGIVLVPYGKLVDPNDLEPGDFNMDGSVNDADALYLLRNTLFEDRYPINLDGDVNCDGTVTDADALYLLRFTLFPQRYPLYPEQ